MLEEVGAPEWGPPQRASDGELLIEVAGRLCYRSFKEGLNPNVTKIREGNREYLGNILKQHHGSVLEHSTATFAFINVSRIFTHEVVRHRAGCAFSQESMRYVRLDNIGMYYPDAFRTVPPDRIEVIRQKFEAAVRTVETAIADLVVLCGLDKLPFDAKKALTSAIRRIAPSGHTTNIIVTANHRAWRHMIELRTAPGAEEEIRKIFHDVAYQISHAFPNIYQDIIMGDGSYEVTFEHSKI